MPFDDDEIDAAKNRGGASERARFYAAISLGREPDELVSPPNRESSSVRMTAERAARSSLLMNGITPETHDIRQINMPNFSEGKRFTLLQTRPEERAQLHYDLSQKINESLKKGEATGFYPRSLVQELSKRANISFEQTENMLRGGQRADVERLIAAKEIADNVGFDGYVSKWADDPDYLARGTASMLADSRIEKAMAEAGQASKFWYETRRLAGMVVTNGAGAWRAVRDYTNYSQAWLMEWEKERLQKGSTVDFHTLFYGPRTAEERLARIKDLDYSIKNFERDREAMKDWLQEVEARYGMEPVRTGYFAYDKVVQPALGVLPSLATALPFGPLGGYVIAADYAAQAYNRMIDSGVDRSTALLLSIAAGAGAKYFGDMNLNNVRGMLKPITPGGRFAANYAQRVGVGALSNTGQSMSSSLPYALGVTMKDGGGVEGFMRTFFGDIDRWGAEAYGGGVFAAILGLRGAPSALASHHINSVRAKAAAQVVDIIEQSPELRGDPARTREAVREINENNGLPDHVYCQSDTLKEYLANKSAEEIPQILEDLGTSQAILDQALEAGVSVSVPLENMEVYAATRDRSALDLFSHTPDGVSIGQMRQDLEAFREARAEAEKAMRLHEELPPRLQSYRDLLKDGGMRADNADKLAYSILGGFKTTARKMGISLEEYLSSKPVELIIEGLNQQAHDAFSTGETIDNAAAQEAYQQYRQERKGRYEFTKALDGSVDHGVIGDDKLTSTLARETGLKPGPVRLEKGNRHFGKVHIENRHKDILESLNLDTAEELVSYVLENLIQIKTANNGRFRLVAKGGDLNTIVINLIQGEGESYYTVTTAVRYKALKNIPGNVVWDGSVAHQQDSGNPARISYRSPHDAAREGTALRTNGQTTPPGDTIRDKTVNVNSAEDAAAWVQDTVETILAGLPPEMAAQAKAYVERVVSDRNFLTDAESLAADIQNAVTQGIDAETLATNPEIAGAIQDLTDAVETLRKSFQSEANRTPPVEPLMQSDQAASTASIDAANAKKDDVRGYYDPAGRVVHLLRNKYDASTVMHEFFHVWHQDLVQAEREGSLLADAVRDLGLMREYAKDFYAKSEKEGDEYLARSFEAYLREGKAPSPQLSGAFEKFRWWLTNMYRDIGEYVGGDLTPEVRNVFDRLLASEDDIAAARRYYEELDGEWSKNIESLKGVVEGLKHVTADEKAAAEKLREKHQAAAQARQARRLLGEVIRQRGGRKGMLQRAKAELSEAPVYQALSYLANNGGMNKLIVEELLGRDFVERIESAHGKGVWGGGGNLGVAAMENGYASVTHMLRDIADTLSLQRAALLQVEAEVSAAQDRANAYLDQDAATPADDAYINNDPFADLVEFELSLARKDLDASRGRTARRQIQAAERQAWRDRARNFIASLPQQRAGQYHHFAEAIRKHRRLAAEAASKGDSETAARELEQVLQNIYLMRASIDARHEMERRDRRYRRLAKSDLSAVEYKYREAAKDMLSHWGLIDKREFRPARSDPNRLILPSQTDGYEVDGKPVDADLDAFLSNLSRQIPEWILNKVRPDPYRGPRDLTLANMRELDDAIQLVLKEGRGELEALRTDQAATFNEQKSVLLASLAKLPDYAKADPRTRKGRLKEGTENFLVSNFLIERILAEADGNPMLQGKEMGLMQNLLRIIRSGEVKQMKMLESFREDTRADFDVLDGFVKRVNERFGSRFGDINGVPIPEAFIDKKGVSTWDAEMILSVFFNMGNRDNRYTLQEGLGLTDEHLQILSGMATAVEWRAIQKVGDRLNELFPLLDDINFRRFNRHLEKVEATPFTVETMDGESVALSGWYYPKAFDPVLSDRTAEQVEMETFKESMSPVHNPASMKDGMLRSRQYDENGNPVVTRPLLLKSSVLVEHITNASRYITHAEALHEFRRLTMDKDVKDLFTQKLGREKYRAVREWTNRMARPEKSKSESYDRVFSIMRSMSTTAALGWNMKSALRQTESLGIAADIMTNAGRHGSSGWRWLARGFKEVGLGGVLGGWIGRPADSIKRMWELSPEAEMRAKNINKDIREALGKSDPTKSGEWKIGRLKLSRDMFFHFTYAMDQAVASTVWWGGFHQAMNGEAGFDINGLTDADLQAKAVAYADYLLRSQQSPYQADYTKLQADKGAIGLFTQFLGGVTPYFSHTYGMARLWRQGDKSSLAMTRHLINVYAMPVLAKLMLAEVLRRAIVGGDDDEDLFTTWGKELSWGVVEGISAPLPLVRDVVGLAHYGARSAGVSSVNVPAQAIERLYRSGVKLTDGQALAAGEDFGRALAVFLPLYNPYKHGKAIYETLTE